MPAPRPLSLPTSLIRLGAISFALVMGGTAAALFLQYAGADGLKMLDIVRASLILIASFWIAWGASQGFIGLLSGLPRQRALSDAPITSRSIILIPVYNEDPAGIFARLAAMDESLAAHGLTEHVHFAVLSDTTSEAIAIAEKAELARLLARRDMIGRVFYRRRTNNVGKKAGNIEEFIRRSGAAYDFALILDADSLMDGRTIGEMIRRIQAEPDLGLLQTLPCIVNARSRFGRAMQFSASLYAPVFTSGLEKMQGATGPFWGHNAIVRISAFAESCALPKLSGRPPFGGHILSHDYVEAALLARAGWVVRVDSDLQYSYEEGPENIIAYAKRDRRWCQGNLQHSRLLTVPNLPDWNRFVFAQGILSYIAPLLWGLFLFSSVIAAAMDRGPNYFPVPYQPFPVFPDNETAKAIGLAIGVFGMLVLPKILIAAGATLSGRARQFGGGPRVFWSMFCELLLSSLVAPVMMMFQSRSVFQVILGRDAGWPASNRDDDIVSWREAWAASYWITVSGVAVLAVTWPFAPALVPWLMPVALPMVAAPWLIVWSSYPGPRPPGVFIAPSEVEVPEVVAGYHKVLEQLRRERERARMPEKQVETVSA